MHVSEPVEIHDDWAVSPEEWVYVGGDFVFACLAHDGDERWFRLRQDLADIILGEARNAGGASGMLQQFELGLGPWGDEPWEAPDFQECIVQLAQPSAASLSTRNGDSVRARDELVRFLRERKLSGDRLVIHDGSYERNRFPEADEGWTETGRPAHETVAVLYRPSSTAEHGWLVDSYDLPPTVISTLQREHSMPHPLAEYLVDATRAPRRVAPEVLLDAVTKVDVVSADLVRLLRAIVSNGGVVVIDSAGRFPTAAPP